MPASRGASSLQLHEIGVAHLLHEARVAHLLHEVRVAVPLGVPQRVVDALPHGLEVQVALEAGLGGAQQAQRNGVLIQCK